MLMNLKDLGLLLLLTWILSSVLLCTTSHLISCLYYISCAFCLLPCFLPYILYILSSALFFAFAFYLMHCISCFISYLYLIFCVLRLLPHFIPCLLSGFCSRLGELDLLVFIFYIVSLDKQSYIKLIAN